MNSFLKTLLVVGISLFSVSTVSAQTMFRVSENTYGTDTNIDIVVDYPNSTNSGSSVNIPGFGSFANGYSIASGSPIGNYIVSLYPTINTGSLTVLIVGTWETPTGTSCYDITNFQNKIVFFSNTLDSKRFFGALCNSVLTVSGTVANANYILIGESYVGLSPLRIDGNGNTLNFGAYNHSLVMDGFFMNNFTEIISDIASVSNGDYHNVFKGIRTNNSATSKNEVRYSVVNLPSINKTMSRCGNIYTYQASLCGSAHGTKDSITYSQNSVILNNKNGVSGNLYIYGATIDRTVIKGYNGNPFVVVNTGTELHIRNSSITNSYIYNNTILYLASNAIGNTAVFNNGTVGAFQGGTYPGICDAGTPGKPFYATCGSTSSCSSGYYLSCTINYGLANVGTNTIVKSAIYNNTDISLLINQQGLTATETLIFNNGGEASLTTNTTALATALKTKLTTPDSSGANYYFDDNKWFYSYVSNSIPSSILTAYPYCGATNNTKGVVTNCGLTTLYFKSVGKTF